MATTPIRAHQATQQRSPQHALFDSLAEATANYANEHMMAMVGRFATSLQDTTQGDSITLLSRVRAGNLLQKNAYAYFHIAATELALLLEREIRALSKAPPDLRRRRTDEALSLVPFDVMDNQLAFDALCAPFESRHADKLNTLCWRLATVLEWEAMRLRQNPFRPQVLLEAFNNAWAQFDPEPESAKLFVQVLRPDLVFDLAPLYESLNQLLVRKGVVPGAAEPRRVRASDQPASGPRAAEQTALARQLRQYFARGNDAAGGSTATPYEGGFVPHSDAGHAPAAGFAAPIDSAPLLAYLARLQNQPQADGKAANPHNVYYLPRLKESAPKGSMSHGDETTIDLLAKVFETVHTDLAIPLEIRDLICFLQVPVLKAALQDKDFFFQEAHPARRMIDLLIRMGWEARRGQDDPMYQAIARNIDRVEREFDQEVSVFADAVSELEASLHKEEQAFESASADLTRAAEREERRVVAAKSAAGAVAMRLGQGDVVAFIDSFLQDKWVQVLTLAYTVEDDKPGAVDNATRTMDELIWSVKPKITPVQRKELIGKLPGLLAAMNRWLDVIQWKDADRLQFFAGLAECHASIVRAPLELSPERQLELAMQAAKQDAEHKLAAEQKQQAAVPEPELFDASVSILERGMWFDFAEGEAVRRVKLAWISPLRTLFIFSTASRKEAFSLTAEALSRVLADGVAKPLGQGVVGRALQDAMMEAAVNDPAMAGVA
jgi:hypothetical protein